MAVITLAAAVALPVAAEYTTADAAPVNVELLGQVGGQINNLLVLRNYAYIGVGPRMIVLDIGDPTQPASVGKTVPLPNPVREIAVNGPHAYVAYGSGLAVVDISQPDLPLVVSTYEEPTGSPAVPGRGDIADHVLAGNDVYVLGSDDLLRVLDVANPSSPALLSSIPAQTGAMSLAGGDIFLAGAGVHVIDVSNGLAPVEVAQFDEGATASDIVVADGHTYVAEVPAFPQGPHGASIGGGLRIFDVSDATNAAAMGFYETRQRNGVQLVGTTAFLSFVPGPDGQPETQVVDVSVPDHPTAIGVLPDVFVGTSADRPYAFKTDGAGSVMVVDVTDPLHPATVGGVSVSPLAGGVKLAISASTLYVAGGDQVQELDVSDTAHMRQIASYRAPGDVASIALNEDRRQLFLTWSNAVPRSGVTILDVSDPTALHEMGSISGPQSMGEVSVSQSYAYLIQLGDITVVDARDPTHPRAVGTISTCKGVASGCELAGSLAVHEDRLYVTYFPSTSGSYGLRIYGLSDPARPVLLTDFRTRGIPSRVRGSTNFAYVSIEAFSPGLQIVDVSEPQHPLEAGFMAANPVRAVAPAGTTLYVAYSDRLHVFDISEPSTPQPVGVSSGIGQVLRGDVVSDGATAYVLMENNGLWAFHLTL